MIRLQNIWKASFQDVLKTSWKRCLEDVFKTSWRRLEDALKTFLQDVLARRFEYVLKTSWRRLQNVLKTSRKGLEDVFARRLKVVLKTSWRRLQHVWPRQIYWYWSRRLEDVFWRPMTKANIFVYIQDVFWRRRRKTSSRRLQDFFSKNVCWDYIMLQIVARILIPWLMWSIFGISCRSVHIYGLSPQIKNSLRKLKIWSHLLKKSLVENVIFCAVNSTLNRIFAETISLNIFSFINRLIEFYNKGIRNKLWKYEHFSCRRKFFEISTTP